MIHADITGRILSAVFEVSRELGHGFLEGVYEKALAIALQDAGLRVACQHPIKVFFRGQEVGSYVADMLVEGKVIVELKAVKMLLPEHQAQVINYLKASGFEVGLLINFGTQKIEYKRLTWEHMSREQEQEKEIQQDGQDGQDKKDEPTSHPFCQSRSLKPPLPV